MLNSFNVLVVATTVLSLQVNSAYGFWRLLCDGSVGLARIDPLTNLGGVSDHVHSIKGGSAFSSVAQSADLDKSNCSSCNVKEDNSAYWAPALYFMNTDENTVEVVPEKPPHKSYYFLNTGRTSDGKLQKVEAFPKGFQMIAGTNRNRNSSIPDPDPNPLGPWPDESQDLRAERALGFNCLNYARGSDEPSLSRHFLPDKSYLDANCADGVRLELMFPSCWNGEMDGGKDHKSHVAFPDGVMVGNCPEGYDRRLVSLFYETIVATDLFKEKNGKFVFSNGDPTGLGYHGDFMEAWAPGVLQEAVDKCTSLSGNMEDCPVFTYNSNPGSCGLENPLPDEIASEDVKGPMEGLPNQIQVQSGPEPAEKPAKKPAGSRHGRPDKEDLPQKDSKQSPETSTVIAKIPTVPVSEVEAPSSRPNDVGDDVPENKLAQRPSSISPTANSEESLSPSTSIPAPAPTSAPAETPVALEAGKTITTEYWTSGRQAHHVVVVLEEVTVTAEGVVVTKTLDAVTEIPHNKRQHKHHHRARGIGGRKFP